MSSRGTFHILTVVRLFKQSYYNSVYYSILTKSKKEMKKLEDHTVKRNSKWTLSL